MALRRVPVDMMAPPFDTATLAVVRARLDAHGVQRQSDDGLPLWEYDLLVVPDGRRPEIVAVTAPSRSTPSYTPGSRVRVSNCYALHYSITTNGRTSEGFSFSANAVTPYPAGSDD